MIESREVYALCYAERFNFAELSSFMRGTSSCTAYRKVLHAQWNQGDVFVFDYGVMVFWNVKPEDRLTLIHKVAAFAENTLPAEFDDAFTYSIHDEANQVKNDHIYLTNGEILTLLAISHGVAQSTKLAQFESQVQSTISETAYIPRNIAQTGGSKLSAKELAKLQGRLFLSKSNIVLNYDLLDVPDFFWEFPELGHYFRMVTDYLEVKQRLDVLSKKLETIHELLMMMAEEQKHRHSSVLEWIVIWLIAFEVVMTIYHEVIISIK